MPKTVFQKYFFMSLTVFFSVASFTVYNVSINSGGISKDVFLLAVKEVPLEFITAFLIEALIAFRLSQKLAFRIVDPAKDRPVFVMLTITCMTVCIMCPSMSFAATVFYNGFTVNFFSDWLNKLVFNFPFAIFLQIFFVGPLVRFIFRKVFRNN